MGDKQEVQDCGLRIGTNTLRESVGALKMAEMNRDPVLNFLKKSNKGKSK